MPLKDLTTKRLFLSPHFRRQGPHWLKPWEDSLQKAVRTVREVTDKLRLKKESLKNCLVLSLRTLLEKFSKTPLER
jgi:hypothetical protein